MESTAAAAPGSTAASGYRAAERRFRRASTSDLHGVVDPVSYTHLTLPTKA